MKIQLGKKNKDGGLFIMVILDLNYTHTDYAKHIRPFLCKGIFIDTSVMKMFIDGYINCFFSKRIDEQYNCLIGILEKLKVNNKWKMFWVTPHILTEICHHFHCDYSKRNDYHEIVRDIIPILKDMQEERNFGKEKILDFINLNKPIIELGDISIFLSVDDIVDNSKKIAILAKDDGFNKRYKNHPNVLVIDYDRVVLSLN